MARDYKHRANRRRGRPPVPFWFWLALGYLLGAASVGFLWIRFGAPAEEGRWIGERPPAAAAPSAGKPRADEPETARRAPPPSFEFYRLLPDQEVVVPEEELAPARDRASGDARPSQPAHPDRKYLLQVGSMRSAREADALKARLALMGLRAQVSEARIRGVTWYRVRLGPFASTAEMQQVRKRLRAAGHDALPIAVK